MMFSIPFLPTSRIRPAFLTLWPVLSLLQPRCRSQAALAVTLVAALLPSSPLAPCPAAHPVAGALRPPRGLRFPQPPSPAATSPSSFDDSDRDLALAALLDAQADLVPRRRGPPWSSCAGAVSNVCCVCTGHNKLLLIIHYSAHNGQCIGIKSRVLSVQFNN